MVDSLVLKPAISPCQPSRARAGGVRGYGLAGYGHGGRGVRGYGPERPGKSTVHTLVPAYRPGCIVRGSLGLSQCLKTEMSWDHLIQLPLERREDISVIRHEN